MSRLPHSAVERIAWFSPMPPIRTGVAVCSGELVAALRSHAEIDVFVDDPVARLATGTRSAHDFVWRHQRQPYDLVVHQLGNSSHHDYQWPYLFRYPGLVVLHDAHLHHARAATLLRTGRRGDYRAEFAASQPDANVDLAELAIAGFDTQLYYRWPFRRLVMLASRMVAVHTPMLAQALAAEVPQAGVEHVRLGHGRALPAGAVRDARQRIRAAYGIPPDAVVFGAFGGLAPEKRIPQILNAFAATRPHLPDARLLLAGASADHYDAAADVRARGLADVTTLTGYLADEEELTSCIAACDVGLTLRWPTAREVSGPWLRCLALGLSTVVVDLAHLGDVPALDPRTWQLHAPASPSPADAVCVAIDIVDEEHSLRLALRRLGRDDGLRRQLGQAAAAYWRARHSVDGMVEDYLRVMPLAAARPAPGATLPAHAVDDCGTTLKAMLAPFGLPSPLR